MQHSVDGASNSNGLPLTGWSFRSVLLVSILVASVGPRALLRALTTQDDGQRMLFEVPDNRIGNPLFGFEARCVKVYAPKVPRRADEVGASFGLYDKRLSVWINVP